jgi:hypothetical protein
MKFFGLVSVAALALAGCASVGGPGTSTFYECDRGTRLKVDYRQGGALVSVNGGSAQLLRATPAASGSAYENRAGWRLHEKGGEALWNSSTRAAPENCRQVRVPR